MLLNVVLLLLGLGIYFLFKHYSNSGFFGVVFVYQMYVLIGVVLPVVSLILNTIFYAVESNQIFLYAGAFWALVLCCGLGKILIQVYEPKEKIRYWKFEKMIQKNGWTPQDIRFAHLSKNSSNLIYLNRVFSQEEAERFSQLLRENDYNGINRFYYKNNEQFFIP